MNAIMTLHIAAGLLALATGTAAACLRKGGRGHVAAGSGFGIAMLVLGATAAVLAPLKLPPESPVGGLMVCYFVATAWMAARRRDGRAGRFEAIAGAAAWIVAACILVRAIELSLAPAGVHRGPPGPAVLYALSAACALAGLGDLRWVRRGRLAPRQRVTRHLWRMCLAFFIATGSFFLGQQDILPAAVRGSPVLWVLALAPFALMLIWLVRVRLAGAPGPVHPAGAR